MVSLALAIGSSSQRKKLHLLCTHFRNWRPRPSFFTTITALRVVRSRKSACSSSLASLVLPWSSTLTEGSSGPLKSTGSSRVVGSPAWPTSSALLLRSSNPFLSAPTPFASSLLPCWPLPPLLDCMEEAASSSWCTVSELALGTGGALIFTGFSSGRILSSFFKSAAR